jgi:hypothetical protein
VPAVNRLRRLLKALLRYYDLRCLAVEVVPPKPAKAKRTAAPAGAATELQGASVRPAP